MSRPTLYLFDGSSILYRSFYAIQRLSNAGGFPTNAIYGFIATMRKIMDGRKPDLLGIVFDTPGPKVRHEIYEDYKAQRKPMPDDLVVQIPRLKEVLSAFRIPLFENSRYEAGAGHPFRHRHDRQRPFPGRERDDLGLQPGQGHAHRRGQG
jgi:DNA polymerase-1